MAVAERVIEAIADTQRLPRGSISLDSSFEELEIDSLDAANLLFVLEDEFDVTVTEDVRSIRTVREAVDGFARLVAETHPPG